MAIEVNLTSGGVDQLLVYQGLGVPEVLIWQNGKLTLYDLRLAEYGLATHSVAAHSQFFPDLDLQVLAQYIWPQEQPQAIKAFLQAIRARQN